MYVCTIVSYLCCIFVYVWGVHLQRPQPSGTAMSERTIKMSEMHMFKCEIC